MLLTFRLLAIADEVSTQVRKGDENRKISAVSKS
jgi:hypothetical protein